MKTYYRKKPVIVQVVQYTGDLESRLEILDWTAKSKTPAFIRVSPKGEPQLKIKTLEGNHLVSKKDYVIKGVAGEFYPCKPDIFHATYEKVAS